MDYAATCAVEERDGTCGAPTQAFLCSKHTDELLFWLWDIGGVSLADSGEYATSLLDELDTTICGDDKVGGASIGVVVRSTDHSISFNERASDAKTALCNTVVGWTKLFAEDNPHLIFDVTTIEQAARWMAGFPNLLAGHPAAVEMHDELRVRVRDARKAIDRRPGRAFLGICGGVFEGVVCDAALHVYEGKHEARCFECGTEWRVEDRRRAMLSSLEDRVAHSGALAALVKRNGVSLASSTVRNYARSGKIRQVGVDEKKRPVYRVGDVLDVLLMRGDTHAA
jgi:hypothetical protein